MGYQRDNGRHGETGIVLVALFVTLMPILLLAGVATTVLRARSASIQQEIGLERALQAAESGIDQLIYTANTVGLTPGIQYKGTLPNGLLYSATASDLLVDGADNDGDGLIDEPDEEAFELRVQGKYRQTKRALVAYLRPVMRLPRMPSALSLQNFLGSLNGNLDVSGASFTINGNDNKIDGSPGTAPSIPGVSIVEPGQVSDLLSGLTSAQKKKIIGAGSAPSAVEVTETIDVVLLAGQAQAIAHNYLLPGTYTSFNAEYGDAAADDWQVTYVGGDLDITGSLFGAGVLVVTGNMTMLGTMDYTGIVIVTGSLKVSGGGSATIVRGGLIVAGESVILNGNVDIEYSSEALAIVKQKLTGMQVVAGWREVVPY